MFNEGPTPISTNESRSESIVLRGEMGGDKGKHIHRDAVDGRKSVPPFADGYQCGCSVPVELRNSIQGETAEEVSKSFFINLFSTHDGE